MKNLKVAAFQYDIAWENPTENFSIIEEEIKSMDSAIDLLVLPEMFSTGFTMNVEKCADKNGLTLQWMQETAERNKIALYASIIAEENQNYYNRGIFAHPDGSFHQYDKRHLFGMGEEDNYYSRGLSQTIVSYKGWKIFLSICYDLRFPTWLRNSADYDLILNIANWPAVRTYAWRQLLIARAIENQAYVIGVNRIGIDGNKLKYTGNSMILDYRGQVQDERAEKMTLLTHSLNPSIMYEFRESHPFLKDMDNYFFEDEL